MSIREVRFLQATEVRAKGGSGDSDPLRIEGYASVFNINAQLPGFQERMQNGAFSRAVEKPQDVVCLFNHDANIVLGRTTSGTLRLLQDDKGLFYTCDLPNTQSGRDIHESIKRGDINGCSFAFTIPEGGQDWSEGRASDGSYFIQRTISDVDLLDVSPVTYPCYTGTSVDARCAEAPVELRSAVAAKNEALKAEVVVVPPAEVVAAVELREAVVAIVPDEDSFQEEICEVDKALAIAFPWVDDGSGSYACGPCNSGRFYSCDTFDDYVIVVECGTGRHFKISYSEDEATEVITFGNMTEVEEAWVPADRAKSREAEFRAGFPLCNQAAAVRQSEDDLEDESDWEDEWEFDDRDKVQASYERLCTMSKDMEPIKYSKIMDRIKSAASAMGYEVKEAGVVSEVSAGNAGRSFEPFTKEEREAMAADLARTFDPDVTSVRYSDDQPRDAGGRFGAGGEQSEPAHSTAEAYHDKQVDSHMEKSATASILGNKEAAQSHKDAAKSHMLASAAHSYAAEAHKNDQADKTKASNNAYKQSDKAFGKTATADLKS